MESSKKCRHKTDIRDTLSLSTGWAAVLIATLLALLLSQVESAGLPFEAMLLSKREPAASASDEMAVDDASIDPQDVRYDEYPVVVPKRAALIIDRILKEIESAKDNTRIENDWGSQITRRGNKEKIYFRCYFNAVSCYRRK